MSEHQVCVVLPAAGIGERMGIATPKQFCLVLNRPLISYTLEAFEKISWIKHIIVSVSPDRMKYMQQLAQTFSHSKVVLTAGASTRHRSIYSGIKVIETVCPLTEVVVIHDAVRPFVDEEVLLNVTKAALLHGAAGVVRNLVSTVVGTDMDGFLDHSLDRSKYRASEMPQAFRYDVIKTAYEQCTDYDLDYGTECLHLAQRYSNVKVRLIDGPDNLWKVTHRKDVFAFESLLKADVRRVNVFFNGTSADDCGELLEDIESSLRVKMCQDIDMVIHQSTNMVMTTRVEKQFQSITVIMIFHNTVCGLSADLSCSDLCSFDPSDLLLVHVFLLKNATSEVSTIIDSVKHHAKLSPERTLLYGIVVKVEDDCCRCKAKDVIASVIFERNPSFSGQTFLCL